MKWIIEVKSDVDLSTLDEELSKFDAERQEVDPVIIGSAYVGYFVEGPYDLGFKVIGNYIFTGIYKNQGLPMDDYNE